MQRFQVRSAVRWVGVRVRPHQRPLRRLRRHLPFREDLTYSSLKGRCPAGAEGSLQQDKASTHHLNISKLRFACGAAPGWVRQNADDADAVFDHDGQGFADFDVAVN